MVGAYVIQQMADRLFSVGNRCSALLAFTQMLQVFLMGNSCVYAIDMVKLRNYVKRKSNWKDADFQTWRLILKRVLSNSAESLDDFIRSEEGGEFEIF